MRVWVTARLDGTEIKATVHAIAEYGDNGRTATGIVEVPEDELGGLTEALVGLLDAHGKRAVRRATQAAAEAMAVAMRRGEEVL